MCPPRARVARMLWRPPRPFERRARWVWASASASSARATGHRRHASSGPRADSDDSGAARPFRVQLYDSIYQRIQREKAEERRQLDGRPDTTVAGRNIALSTIIISSAVVFYLLGASSPAPLPPASTIAVEAVPPLQHNVKEVELQATWADLVEIVGRERVSTTADDVGAHASSAWSSYAPAAGERPFLVVYPTSTEEVSRIAHVCHRRRVPMTAYGGGTSLEGHYAATRGGVCIDFQAMDRIVALHATDLDVVVQPGVEWERLNEALAPHGLFFPPDPGPGARIGGMVATGCSGTNAFRYGGMGDWVVSLTVVLADGSVIHTRQRPRKSSAGYNLTRLFVGSEGTLGLVTEATLRVAVRPAHESVAVASFDSVGDAARCVARCVADGIPLAAVELLDDVQMRCVNASGATSRPWAEAPTLFFKFAAATPGALHDEMAAVRAIARAHRARAFDRARNAAEQAELWSARKAALWSVMAMRRDAADRVWTTDVAVPISRLPDIITATKADLTAHGLLAGIVGHVGDGNFHAIILFNERERAAVEAVIHRMVTRAIEMEGTVTGEHGVGLIKRDYLPLELGTTTVDAMRKLKLAFDPLCLLNPDKIVRLEPPRLESKWW